MKTDGPDEAGLRSIEAQELSIDDDGKTFLGCRDMDIEHVDIPEGITAIGPKAFLGFAYHLRSVKLPASLTDIAPGALFVLTKIELAPGNPDGVTEIGERAFLHCTNLKQITLPASVEKIGEDAFKGAGCEEQVKQEHPHLFGQDH